MKADGFEINELGKKVAITVKISLSEFVPHQKLYLEKVVKLIADNIN